LRLGTTVLRSIALGTSLFRAGAAHDAHDVARLQQRAFHAAEMALGLAGASPERDEAFTGALLCDVGLAVLAAMAPDRARAIAGTGAERLAAERLELGATHAEIGAQLLDLWGLPLSIVEAVGKHHTPEEIPSAHALVAAIAHVTDALIDSEEPYPPLVAAYGLEPGIARLRAEGSAAC
jgi:HD-like signal output (HDOD) protein